MSTFYIENFGCRATQADGAAIARQFRDQGLGRADSPANAELVILNTCTVTASADQDARASIRRIHRQNPNCQIVVTGCYAQRAPEEIAALPGVTQVVGNSHKHKLAQLVLPTPIASSEHSEFPAAERRYPLAQRVSAGKAAPDPRVPQGTPLLPNTFVPLSLLVQESPAPGQRPTTHDQRQIYVSDIFAHTELQAAPVFEGEAAGHARTRPNLKVQDGCNNRCSFCVIPSVRGQSRSLPFDKLLSEVNALVESGYREVVISGINLGRWGRDLSIPRLQCQRPTTHDQRLRFENLIHAILNQTALEKLRLSSIEPMDWSEELIALMAHSPRIAKHAHVPMQSGSDRILRRMHRKYRPWHYRQKIEQIRAAMPTAAIGADVMVGFPGETDADFEATRRMIEELPLTYLHIFTYSSRPGTPSASMPNQVPVNTARERNRILRDLAAQKKQTFLQRFVGKEIQAITLNSLSSRPERHGSQSESCCAVEGPAVQPAVYTEALTDNYLKLHLRGHHQPNHWITAKIERQEDEALVGFELPAQSAHM